MSEFDWGEFREDMKQQSIDRRASNRENSAQVLTDHGVSFDSRNDGAHLIVTHAGRVFDFWPGTGLFKDRQGKQGRGVFGMLKALGVQPIAKP